MTGTKLTTDEQLQNLGIQLFDLDFVTRKTSHSTISYFMPSKQDIDIANSGIDAVKDYFTKSCRSKHRKVRVAWAYIYLLYPISTRLISHPIIGLSTVSSLSAVLWNFISHRWSITILSPHNNLVVIIISNNLALTAILNSPSPANQCRLLN